MKRAEIINAHCLYRFVNNMLTGGRRLPPVILFLTIAKMKCKSFNKLIIILLLFTACNPHSKNEISSEEGQKVNYEEELPLERICRMDNFPSIVGEISSFGFLDREHFVIGSKSSAQVLLFNTNGDQVAGIGTRGRGKFEYLAPAIVRVFDQKVFVWCDRLLKMIVFDRTGKPVGEFSFSRSIKDFVVYKNLICFYSAGGFDDEGLVRFYDITVMDFVKGVFVEQTNEHHILNANVCSGGMGLKNNKVVFAPTDQTVIYEVNLDDFSLEAFPIPDPEFNVNEVKVPYKEFIGSMQESVKYVLGSDLIENVLTSKSHVVLIAGIGEITFNGMEVTDYSERRVKMFFLNNEMEVVQTIVAKPEAGSSSCLFAAHEDSFYAIKYSDDYKFAELYLLNWEATKSV